MSEILFYHTYNRGVDKRKIFLEDSDYSRGVHDLYEFNDAKAVTNFDRRSVGFPKSNVFENKAREKLIDMGAWCLMPNHYHLFLSPVIDDGLVKFHKKLGVGFANFFNTKYKRSGALFQGKYKKVQVVDDVQALQLICYIHSNPLDLWKPDWKEKGLINSEIQNALGFLEKGYRWSSHLDWWGVRNFPSLIEPDFMSRFFKNPEEYREFFTNWLRYYEKSVQLPTKFVLE
ncbi:MAG: transposase [Candidatus Nealsonbacteria bacterium]